MLIAVCVSAHTMTMGMYEDASCTQLKPLSQCYGWVSNPVVIKFGECKNYFESYGMAMGIEPVGDCSTTTFKENMYGSGCGKKNPNDKYNPLTIFNGKCFGANGFYQMSTCK